MTALGIRARTPEYLLSKVEAAEARNAVKNAQGRVEWMESRSATHTEQLAKADRSGYTNVLTNQQARQWTGGGATVIYATRCEADGHDCEHDPRAAPYSDTDLRSAIFAIGQAERRLANAEKALAAAEESSSLDVAEACRQAGTRYAWWPDEVFPDPTKRRYQGQPITADELDALGPFELQRQVASGHVLEIHQ